MVTVLIIAVFLLGYISIAFEHKIKLNKAASALITGVLCWTIYILESDHPERVSEELLRHAADIASIDSHNGFEIITQKITTKSKRQLLFIVTIITFFLSALLDNLTTSIVMVSLCSRLLINRNDKFWFAGIIIISANAGGVWSPLGDVTTTMLWIGGQVTASAIAGRLILPGIVVCLVPFLLVARRFKGKYIESLPLHNSNPEENRYGRIILFSGIGFLIFVPLFKTITHLPPFMGMLLALGFMWIITNIVNKNMETSDKEKFTVARALQKIDSPSILFFVGILLAVSALQSCGILKIETICPTAEGFCAELNQS